MARRATTDVRHYWWVRAAPRRSSPSGSSLRRTPGSDRLKPRLLGVRGADDDRVDIESLRRTVDFCVEAGSHGIVAPVNASEGPFLTDEERRQVVETLVE